MKKFFLVLSIISGLQTCPSLEGMQRIRDIAGKIIPKTTRARIATAAAAGLAAGIMWYMRQEPDIEIGRPEPVEFVSKDPFALDDSGNPIHEALLYDIRSIYTIATVYEWLHIDESEYGRRELAELELKALEFLAKHDINYGTEDVWMQNHPHLKNLIKTEIISFKRSYDSDPQDYTSKIKELEQQAQEAWRKDQEIATLCAVGAKAFIMNDDDEPANPQLLYDVRALYFISLAHRWVYTKTHHPEYKAPELPNYAKPAIPFVEKYVVMGQHNDEWRRKRPGLMCGPIIIAQHKSMYKPKLEDFLNDKDLEQKIQAALEEDNQRNQPSAAE